MRMNFIRKELLEFINQKVKPVYKTFDKAHNLSHFKFVTNNCIKYARELNSRGADFDLEIAYVVGAMHDIGIINGREDHAKSSGEIVRKETELRNFFSEEVMEVIAQAVEDHSSHLGYEPRNIYGKLVADADRNNIMYLIFARPIKFGLKHESYRTRESHIDRVYEFVNNKFGRNGYVKYWLDIEESRKEQQKVWEMLDNEQRCKAYIAGLFDEITKGRVK